MKRLSFIKYLYKTAIEQSLNPEPLCSVAILLFHDSIELFLQLASEFLNAGKSKPNFLDYWDLLKQAGIEITQKEAMRRLNGARVALKHAGTQPSKFDIEAFRASVTNFFEENTSIVFKVAFADISLLDLVQCEDTRSNLRDADKLLGENKLEESLDKIGIAFDLLIQDYEKRKTRLFGHSPFFFSRGRHSSKKDILSGLNLRGAGVESTLSRSIDKALNDLISGFKEEIEILQSAIKIISLGIDYRRYAKFKIYVPNVSWSVGGVPYIYRYKREIIPSLQDIRFCIEFVIESAITLQEFDFSLEEHQ
jgi:hypothetical protein